MDQLYCIYRSIEKSICSTISASFPSACIVSFLAFISYMVLRLFFSLHKNRSKIFGCFRYGLSGRLDCDIYLLHIYGIVSYLDCKETLGRSVRQDIWRLGLIYRKGNLTTEAIENVMLLFPFTFLLGILLRKRWKSIRRD